jgi:4-hydroxy-tetrahydrodipicolinate reductase
MVRVGVFGAGGRMGTEVCRAVVADPELELVAAVDPFHAGLDVRSVTRVDVPLQVAASPEALIDAKAEVVVDFTQLDPARENLAWVAAHGVHAVVGTTGFSAEDLDRFRATFIDSNCFIAPNFAIGAVLMMRFAELAAPYFESAEIIELHHDQKIDAPSGTAMLTAERMAAASEDWVDDPTRSLVVEGARGGRGPGGIGIHSVRLRGLVAHQEVLLGTAGQSLTIRHDSYDRSSFMPGVLLAIKRIGERPGVTVGLDNLLDL